MEPRSAKTVDIKNLAGYFKEADNWMEGLEGQAEPKAEGSGTEQKAAAAPQEQSTGAHMVCWQCQ